jgi:hypothetical protein
LLLVSAGTLGGQFIWFGYQPALSYRSLCFLFLSLFSRHGSSLYYLFSILMNDKAPIVFLRIVKLQIKYISLISLQSSLRRDT